MLLALALPACPQKRWADAGEYNLCSQAAAETEPDKVLEILREWETAYPRSEFERERNTWLVMAYEKAGQPIEAFVRAMHAFRLQPNEILESYQIAVLAPLLTSPSPEQVRVTEAAAAILMARASEAGRDATAVSQADKDNGPEEISDPETDRVTALIREWRKGKHERSASDVEGEMMQVAVKALAWAKGARPLGR